MNALHGSWVLIIVLSYCVRWLWSLCKLQKNEITRISHELSRFNALKQQAQALVDSAMAYQQTITNTTEIQPPQPWLRE